MVHVSERCDHASQLPCLSEKDRFERLPLCKREGAPCVHTQRTCAIFELDREHFTRHDKQEAIKHLGKSAIRRPIADSWIVTCWLGTLAICFGKSAGSSAKSRVVSQDNNNPSRRSTIKTGVCTERSPIVSLTDTEPSTCIGDPSADCGRCVADAC